MLHKLFEEGAWFAPKRYGLGAGLPIAWQGWVLMLSFLLLLPGIMLLGISLAPLHPAQAMLFFALAVAATLLFVRICQRKTRGGWRWRWGGKE
ncbi:hypothetical protein [Sphingobium nicotianae]|uniref:DUF4175 domain-containing protein n=1 Tax=Sphingobium nicotianae TaxID=2782607 RepID=A0A9X1DEQ8_9SPHN|nr:hypothetical protein [Sphingobium nicotianae]MBT2188696.1 hypothetical protein [Sphingobium nicotianae]